VDEIVARSLDDLGPRSRHVVVDIPESLPEVRVDPSILERVIVNVTENALRYSPPDRPPLLTASALADRVELRVIDRGPGIPVKERDRVFVPFQRLGDTDNTTGVGLGLALSRGFTEAMGGTLTAEDTPGGGLTMALSLPTVAPAPGPGPGEAEPGHRERDADPVMDGANAGWMTDGDDGARVTKGTGAGPGSGAGTGPADQATL
jgi:two-component system sensor histidine kinase KdpD